jgi:hypothetical protein
VGGLARCEVCGKEDRGDKDFICETCGKQGITTLYCENCRGYLYVPAAEFFNSSFAKLLKKDGIDLTGPESCSGLIIKFIGGCNTCRPAYNEGGIILFRVRGFGSRAH